MRYLKPVSVLLFVSLLMSCASNELNKSQKREIKKIGIAVLVNDFYTIDYVGITIFNNKHYEFKSEPNEYIRTISDAAEAYLKTEGYGAKKLDVSNDLRKEYKGYMSRKLETELADSAKLSGVDTIVVLHDGKCSSVAPANSFGQTASVHTSGHGLTRRVGFAVQQHVCLTIDIVKVKDFEPLAQYKIGRNGSYGDRDVITRIAKAKGVYKFTEYENRILGGNFNKYFKFLTEIALEQSNL